MKCHCGAKGTDTKTKIDWSVPMGYDQVTKTWQRVTKRFKVIRCSSCSCVWWKDA